MEDSTGTEMTAFAKGAGGRGVGGLLIPLNGLLIFSSSCICFSQTPEQLLRNLRLLPLTVKKKKKALASCGRSAPSCAELSVEASRSPKAKRRRHHQEPQLPFPAFQVSQDAHNRWVLLLCWTHIEPGIREPNSGLAV